MGFFTLLITAISLSMDAFAVSVANGISIKKLKPWHMIKFGIFFGTAQFVMPLLGGMLALGFAAQTEAYDCWIAFILLSLIGGKMIYEAFNGGEGDTEKSAGFFQMLVLAVATSIDALAVGVSLAALNTAILPASVLIGFVTFILSSAGVYFGRRIGAVFKKRAEIAGGLALILIGIKILVERLFFS